MAGGLKQLKKAEWDKVNPDKAIKNTTKRIRELDLELQRILVKMESAPLCQKVHIPGLIKTRKTKRRR